MTKSCKRELSSCCTPTSSTTSCGDFTERKRPRLWKSLDTPLTLSLLMLLFLAIFAPEQSRRSLEFTIAALLNIAPWILFSTVLAAYAQASSADKLIAFHAKGHPVRMVAIAAMLGVLAPFCSCGVVPLIAGMLAAGVPIAPVMAFWISSPLMDPTMFVMTAANLGIEFAVVKSVSAIAMAAFAGLATHFLTQRGVVSVSLRSTPATTCATSSVGPIHFGSDQVSWRVWENEKACRTFARSVRDGIWFLLRWMTLAYMIESVVASKIPAELVSEWLGAGNAAIPLAVAIGIPSYLNGYAALPLVGGLLKLGMHPPVALAFLVAGGVTSIPAMAAVWGLVKPKVFALYLGLALSGSLVVSFAYQAILSL